MNPVLMAALISGGINALQGKRGSDLLKSTVRDTAIAYALGSTSPLAKGGSEGIASMATDQIVPGTVNKAAEKQMLKELAKEQTTKPTGFLGKLERGLGAIEKPFLKPDGSGDISKFRVGLGSAGLGAAAYGAGLFDPTPPPDPKYPGFNRFYASDPEMFQPLSGKYGPDYEKYPEGSPYSGMQEGGIADANMMSPDDEMLQFDMEQQKTADGPGIVANLMERFKDSIKDPKMMKAAMKARPLSGEVTESEKIEIKLPARIKKDFIMKFKEDPDKTAIEYATTMADKDRLTIADVQKAKEQLIKLTNETEMDVGDIEGIMGLMSSPQGEQVRVPEAPPTPDAIKNLMDTFRSRAANEPRMQQFNKGDIVDVLPSKLKRDENDTSNYKRTSGKMVTDETGKGSGNKDTMLAQLADGEFVTKAKSVLGAGKAMGGKNKKEQRELGAKFFYKQKSELEKIAGSV